MKNFSLFLLLLLSTGLKSQVEKKLKVALGYVVKEYVCGDTLCDFSYLPKSLILTPSRITCNKSWEVKGMIEKRLKCNDRAIYENVNNRRVKIHNIKGGKKLLSLDEFKSQTEVQYFIQVYNPLKYEGYFFVLLKLFNKERLGACDVLVRLQDDEVDKSAISCYIY